MTTLLVIADDFTGALDTGVQFSKAGVATWVVPDARLDYSTAPSDCEVVVVNTNSRHQNGNEAAAIVHRIARTAAARGMAHLYKKTDSTLRGNIGAELGALMDAFGGQPVMFLPAYPKAGRTTVAGRQYVHGVPLGRTVAADDPLDPMRTGDIAAILHEQTAAAVVLAAPDEDQALHEQHAIYIFDGKTDADLHAAGKVLLRKHRLKLLAGCAGFAAHLPDLLGLGRKTREDTAWPRRVLLVCGSVNPHSIRQMQTAEAMGYESIWPSQRALLHASYWDTPSGQHMIRQAARALDEKGKVAIQSIQPGGERLQADGAADIANSMGVLTAGILRRAKPCTLAVFGGDTAMGVMEALGCTGLLPGDEIEPGVATSLMQNATGLTPLISKAGGLGSERVLQRIEEYLRRRQ